MMLELKESNSPFWLLGLSKGKYLAGSSTNIPCYYKTFKKQKEIANTIISDPNVDEVYRITGIEWDNMKGSWDAKETGSYIQNKGKLILSKDELIEDDYPKDMSRDPLPKKGVKTYTSVATALEGKGDEKMKLELKEENVVSIDDISEDLQDRFFTTMSDGRPDMFKKFTKEELKLFADFVKQLPDTEITDFERSMVLVAISLAHGDDLTVESINDDTEELHESNQYTTEYKPGDVVQFIRPGNELSEETAMITGYDNDGFYEVKWSDGKISNGLHDKNLKLVSKSDLKEAVPVKAIVAGIMYTVDNWDTLKDIIETIKSTSAELYDKCLVIYEYLKNKNADIKEAVKEITDLISKNESLKESKIVTPMGNPQTAGSFVNIDVDLDHMEVSDFIVRLAQAIRSEQTSILEYVAMRSANGITNEERTNIDSIIEEEKNHMVAFTAMLYKQILMNHKQNVDGANNEFTLPKFGADLFNEDNKLKESVTKMVNKIVVKEAIKKFTNKELITKYAKKLPNDEQEEYNVKDILANLDSLEEDDNDVEELAIAIQDMLIDDDVDIEPANDNSPTWIINETAGVRMSDDFFIGNREDGRMYHGLSQALNVVKNMISTSGEEVIIQNSTLHDNVTENKDVKLEDTFNSIDELINELKTDTNYDEIAHHIHSYAKTNKARASELMDKLFELERSKSPKECVDILVNELEKENEQYKTEDIKTKFAGETMSQEQWDVVVDVDYDADFQLQVVNNLSNAIQTMNPETAKSDKYAIAEDKYTLAGNKFNFEILTYAGFDKEINEDFVAEVCDKLFTKATTYEYYIKRT